MAKQFIFYNLKDGVNEKDFVKWVNEFKGPFISGLSSVKGYALFKTISTLKSEKSHSGHTEPPYRIVEVIDITRFEDYQREQETKAYKEDFIPQLSNWIQNILILQAQEFYHSEIDFSDQRIV